MAAMEEDKNPSDRPLNRESESRDWKIGNSSLGFLNFHFQLSL